MIRSRRTHSIPTLDLSSITLEQLPSATGSASEVTAWRNDVQAFGLGLLREVPLDHPLPRTPSNRHGYIPSLPVAEAVMRNIAEMFGQIGVMRNKVRAVAIEDVFYVREDAMSQLGSGCSELTWHVEDGCFEDRPDWVALLCIRGQADARTKVARTRDMQLPDHIDYGLRTTSVPLVLDDSFLPTPSCAIHVYTLSGDRSCPEIVFDPAYMVEDSSTAEINSMVAVVLDSADRASIDIVLESGDLLIFNNRTNVHGRSSYRPIFDGEGRWVKRANIFESPATIGGNRCEAGEPT